MSLWALPHTDTYEDDMPQIIDSHRQAITTKTIHATTHRGVRVKAWCWKGSVTVHYDYALNADQNHYAAAEALLKEMGWAGDDWAQKWMAGSTHDNTGYHFVAMTTDEGTRGA